MDLADLITNDHTIFDGVQTITLKNPAGTSSDSVAYVTSGPVSFKALQMIGGGLVDSSQTLAFSLPATLCAFAPTDSSTITDASGVVWRVLSVDVKTLDKRYTCNCVRDKLELSAPLAPTDLDLSTPTAALSVAWRETSGATTYRVEICQDADFDTGVQTATGNISAVLSGTTATVEFSGLTDALWYVRVRRTNALGTSPWSDVSSATTSS
jgi:hypothetical protein